MKKILTFLLITLFISCQSGDINREPTGVTITDIQKNDPEYIVYRNMYYTLDSVRVDTVWVKNSSLSTPRSSVDYMPGDMVDLNDIFSGDSIDYNYAVLTPLQMTYLMLNGIYWDSESAYWRKGR